MILAGDIGGTKTNLAVFSHEQGAHEPVLEATFPSAAYAGIEEIAQTFLQQAGMTVEKAYFGVAGPVVDNEAKITNLPWTINAAQVRDTLKLQTVKLLNDLESIANAVPILEPIDVHTLNTGTAVKGGTIGVIAPGTGLGEAFLTWDGSQYRAYPSEGGHTSFGPTDATQIDMLRYLLEHYEHISYERICSGLGLPNIYAYFKESKYAEELPEVAEQLATAADLTPVIVNAALNTTNPSPLSQRTLEMFVSILGAEASNLALKVLATGGIYIGGGIPPRILSNLEQPEFMQAFRHKGRFAEMLANVPIHVILNPKAGLLGAAHAGLSGL